MSAAIKACQQQVKHVRRPEASEQHLLCEYAVAYEAYAVAYEYAVSYEAPPASEQVCLIHDIVGRGSRRRDRLISSCMTYADVGANQGNTRDTPETFRQPT